MILDLAARASLTRALREATPGDVLAIPPAPTKNPSPWEASHRKALDALHRDIDLTGPGWALWPLIVEDATQKFEAAVDGFARWWARRDRGILYAVPYLTATQRAVAVNLLVGLRDVVREPDGVLLALAPEVQARPGRVQGHVTFDAPKGWYDAAGSINQCRDRLSKRYPCPLYLILSEMTSVALTEAAPDLWSCRELTVDLTQG